jgi:hypothetical protein
MISLFIYILVSIVLCFWYEERKKRKEGKREGTREEWFINQRMLITKKGRGKSELTRQRRMDDGLPRRSFAGRGFEIWIRSIARRRFAVADLVANDIERSWSIVCKFSNLFHHHIRPSRLWTHSKEGPNFSFRLPMLKSFINQRMLITNPKCLLPSLVCVISHQSSVCKEASKSSRVIGEILIRSGIHSFVRSPANEVTFTLLVILRNFIWHIFVHRENKI